MDTLFEVQDKTNRTIYLSKERWKHIQLRHPNITDINQVEDTIINPLRIIPQEDNITFFYKHFKHRKEQAKYLKVIVNYLNGKGHIITAYFVKKIP